MAREPVDLLVIGGGVTGAGIARDAAMRGMRTALVDKGDFAGGTSSRSSRLIHGGLRYLEFYEWHLVFEASRERRTLLRIAPHLVWPREFIFPVYAGTRLAPWKLAAGLWLYDALALFRNVERHRMLSKRRTLRVEPALRERGLRAAARYFDAQCDDARLTLANARSAHEHGALVANYARVDRLEMADGQVRGATVTDVLSGDRHGVRALAVINATGPWGDGVAALAGDVPQLRLTKGAHITVPRARVGHTHAITVISPVDGRVMFVVPWGDLSYIGTTDSDFTGDIDAVEADADDVLYLLRSVNALFPHARLAPEDVISAWAALRPLLRPLDARAPGAVSREHRITRGPTGLISVLGGKLTTYRSMAAEAADLVAEQLHYLDGRPRPPRPPTAHEPLPGGAVRDVRLLVEDAVRDGSTRATAERLVRIYGSEMPAIIRLARSDPSLGAPLAPPHPATRAEVVHAIRREMAVTLSDLLMRRLHLFYEVLGQAAPEAAGLVEFSGSELGWDAARKASELADYLANVARMSAFRTALRQRFPRQTG